MVGVLTGAGTGWLLRGDAVHGALFGFIFCLGLSLVHLYAVTSGQVVVTSATPTLDDQPELPRNHIICIDGTWNQPEVPTNVRKFFDCVSPAAEKKRSKHGRADDGTEQLVKYYCGVGARENLGVGYDVLKQRYSKTLFGGAFGLGVRGIVRQAYFDFVEDYRPGDKIFIVGFSRGAAIARMLANMICETDGLPERVDIRHQKSQLRQPIVHDLDVIEPRKYGTPEVELLGVWDTVAALGIPGNHLELFADLSLPDRVKAVCHLVAVDEVRQEFDATLFDHDERVEEVWFPGAHTNVGGGWETDNRLSDLALRFMLDRARDLGVAFTPEADLVQGDVNGRIWQAGPHWVRRIQRQIRVQGEPQAGRPRIHDSVFERIDRGVLSPDEHGQPYHPENVVALEPAVDDLRYSG